MIWFTSLSTFWPTHRSKTYAKLIEEINETLGPFKKEHALVQPRDPLASKSGSWACKPPGLLPPQNSEAIVHDLLHQYSLYWHSCAPNFRGKMAIASFLCKRDDTELSCAVSYAHKVFIVLCALVSAFKIVRCIPLRGGSIQKPHIETAKPLALSLAVCTS